MLLTCAANFSLKLSKLYLSAVEYPTTDHESRPIDVFFFKFSLAGRNFKGFDTFGSLDDIGLINCKFTSLVDKILVKMDC